MAGLFYKPQSPIMYLGDYIYPLTYYDQIILPDGTRWNGILANSVLSVNGKTGAITLTANDVGAAASSHTHSQYFETSNFIFSATEPTGTAGQFWLKPAE